MIWEDNYMNTTNTFTADLLARVATLVALLDLNERLATSSPYKAVEVADQGRKYINVVNVLTNGQRSARFMISADGSVYNCEGWKVRGRFVGDLDRLIASFSQANTRLSEARALRMGPGLTLVISNA